MHFDSRIRRAPSATGLDPEEIREFSDRIAAAVAADTVATEAFVAGGETVYSLIETVYSLIETAHGATDVRNRAVEYVDAFARGGEL